MRANKKAARTAGNGAFRYEGERLHDLWDALHRGDREPWPEPKMIARFGAQSPAFEAWIDAHGGPSGIAQGLRSAWREFHAGSFPAAIKLGTELGALGASVANKAAAIYTLYTRINAAQRLQSLDEAAKRAEAAVKLLPDYANAHYMLALVLGRYSQGISIIKAVAQGLAGRVRTHLERAIELEPRHAEAHVALGLYHTELIGKLGSIAAGLTYGASRDRALEQFRQAVKLAPASPIVRIEYANGLMLLDAARNRAEAEALYAEAAAFEPVDAMEQLDIKRASRGVD
jgi:tetratricopeptide (TPR) repeat protein